MADRHPKMLTPKFKKRAPKILPGWPGYRTQPGRSGLDWIDTQLEMAHMAGIFLRQLFSGSWLRPNLGPHPLITLIVGITLLFAFPAPREACPALIIVLIIGIVVAVQNRSTSQSGNVKEEAIERDNTEEDTVWQENNSRKDKDM